MKRRVLFADGDGNVVVKFHSMPDAEAYVSRINARLEAQGLEEQGWYFADDGTEPICVHCGKYGERAGHMTCAYPQDAP